MRTDIGRSRSATAAVAVLTVVTSATFAVLVPPYESPDEHAHAEYVRHVAERGLPRLIPPPGDPGRRLAYEWVQPPLYYVLAAPLARAAGTSSPTVLEPDPSSRLSGGRRWVIYSHDAPLAPPELATRLYVLRAFGVLLAVICVVATTALTRAVTGSATAAAFAGAALALVPQWTAILASVGNDGLSTTLAALAMLSLWPLVAGQTVGAATLAGLLSGAALATKLTTACLVPGLAYALWRTRPGRRTRLAAAALVAFVAAGGWPFVANLVLHGDPLAADFKRAALVAGGFTAAAPGVPSPLQPGFWQYFVVMVVEPFWARFGSLGAGLAAGSRGWLAYFVATGIVAVAIAGGTVAAWARRREPGSRDGPRQDLARALTVTVVTGLALWLGANVVNPSSMVVHWTPRHVMPLTSPLVALGALGAVRGTSWLPRPARLAVGLSLLAGLSGLWAIVVRDVLAAFQ